ncbi:unnamed protein product, partial [Choristocarpus tenellus]
PAGGGRAGEGDPDETSSLFSSPQDQHQAPEEEGVFHSSECLTVGEAVWLYTVGAAIAAGEERHLGRLEPGFLADLTVLDDVKLIKDPR